MTRDYVLARVDVRTDELPQAEFGLVHDPGFHGEGRIRASARADRLDIAGLRFLSVVL
jgi:hypothetical protein